MVEGLRTGLAVITALGLWGCGEGAPPLGDVNSHQTGTASFYAHKFHGRTTASGEVYDMHKLTAAHRTLPFGTKVKVTNLDNGKKIVLRITDRGPFVKGRIIDVSLKAAQYLEFVQQGLAKVRVEVVEAPRGS